MQQSQRFSNCLSSAAEDVYKGREVKGREPDVAGEGKGREPDVTVVVKGREPD